MECNGNYIKASLLLPSRYAVSFEFGTKMDDELVTGQEVKPWCYAAEGRREGGSTFYTTTSPTLKSAEVVKDVLPHPVQETGELSQWSHLEQSRASITSETCIIPMMTGHSSTGEQMKVKAHVDQKVQIS